MKPRDAGFWLRSDRRRAICAPPGWAVLSVALLMPAVMQAQVLSGAAVQLGQTSLNLPSGSSIYIYGMGTGGALGATNFAQGPYAQVVDQGGQVVAGLAITPSNNNSFTTDCADYTIGAIGVTGFKTVSASYAASNQPHPTAVSDSFLVSDPAVVVVFAIGGGEDHLDLHGLPGLQIDAQKGPDQSHGIAIAIGHANLGPGKYTVTETTEGDPGRDPAHEGDLIGVFVFTGGSGAAVVLPPAGPSSGRGGTPSPPPSSVQPPPAPSPVKPAPLYVFNGAYATYSLQSGTVSFPITVSVSDVDTAKRMCKVTTTFSGPYSSLSRSDSASFDQMPIQPSDLNFLRMGQVPPGSDDHETKVLPNVRVSVPAGTFITEQAVSKDMTLWVDARSGVIVKVAGPIGNGPLADKIPHVAGSYAILELMKTNAPMSVATSPALLYGLIVGVIILVVGGLAYAFVGRSSHQRSAPVAVRPLAPASAMTRQVADSLGSTAPPSPARRRAITGDALDKLAKLKSMLDAGVISKQEFEGQKAMLLGGSPPSFEPEELRKLKSLFDAGALTQEEYEAQRRRILATL